MSVSFNSNFAANQRVAFQENQEKRPVSYVKTAAKGVLGGGILGASVAVALKKAAVMEVASDSFTLNKIKTTAESLSASTSAKKFACVCAVAGAAIGAVGLILQSTFKSKKDKTSLQNLKPIS